MPQPAPLNPPPWRRRNIVLLAVAGGASLLLAFALLLYRGDGDGPAVGANGYSRSAIGHLGLVQLLKRLGRPVLLNHQRLDPLGLQRRQGVMVLAEPQPVGERELATMRELLQALPQALLVLPKRRGGEVDVDPDKPAWLLQSELQDLSVPQRLLDELADDGDVATVLRTESTGRWRLGMQLPEPSLGDGAQLLAPAHVDARVDCRQGVLLGQVGDTWVLSDPDLLANHGLADGDNAEFMVALLDRLRGDGPIVFDETLHGRIYDPSVFEVLGRWPLVLLPVHLLLLMVVVLWVAAGRFGAPLAPPRAIAPGKAFLIDNIAALLGRAGRDEHGLEQYFDDRLRAAAKQLHAPPGLDAAGCRQWLAARSGSAGAAELQRLTDEVAQHPQRDRALAVARAIQHWTEEITHGTR